MPSSCLLERSPGTLSGHAVPYKTYAFSISKLPDAALQQICALASTPACPAPCLLTVASKEWAAAVATQMRDAPVQLLLGTARPSSTMAAALAAPPRTNILQLQPASGTPQTNQPADKDTARIQADCARLFSLSMWLRKNSSQIGAFTLTSQGRYPGGLDVWQRSLLCSATAAVMQGLAPGQTAKEGLRLTAMDMEVLSSSQLQATLDTLAACQRLRRLRLTGAIEEQRSVAVAAKNWKLAAGATASSSACTTTATTSSSMFRLGAALSGMSALTHLQLCAGLLCNGNGAGANSRRGSLDLHPLLLKLPKQLQELHLTGFQQVTLSLASIKHLVQLQRLLLPCHLELVPPPDGVTTASLVFGLTQLSSLKCGAALSGEADGLLELPGLQHVSNESSSNWSDTDTASIRKLGAVKTLRALQLQRFDPQPLPPQLQHLTLVRASYTDSTNSLWMEHLRTLENLQSLDLLARLLLTKMDPAADTTGEAAAAHPLQALTALTRLAVNCKGASSKVDVAAPAAAAPAPAEEPVPDAVQDGAAPAVAQEAAATLEEEHPLGAVGRVLDLVHREAGNLQRLELSWVDRAVAEVLAAAATQLPGVVVKASEGELGTEA